MVPESPLTDANGERGPLDRAVLTDQWFALFRSWPSDGWDGAGNARAQHAAAVRTVEALLSGLHEHDGHGPIEHFGVNQERCVCGTWGDNISDLRRFDRYGKWMDPSGGSGT